MYSRSPRVVHEGCLDEGDGWQTDYSKRCPGFIVRSLLFTWVRGLTSLRLGNGCLGTLENELMHPTTCILIYRQLPTDTEYPPSSLLCQV